MEEKEGYELAEEDFAYAIVDNKEHKTYQNDCFDFSNICDLLNQQDKRIKELESEVKVGEFWHSAYQGKQLEYDMVYAELRKAMDENQQLKQQLKDIEESYNNTMKYLNKTRSELFNLPKKIVEDIRIEIQTPFQLLVDEVSITIDISKTKIIQNFIHNFEKVWKGKINILTFYEKNGTFGVVGMNADNQINDLKGKVEND